MSEAANDIATAQRIYELIQKMGPSTIDGIDVLCQSQTPNVLGGYICLFSNRPSAGVSILIGQFSTPGLCAAVGSLPVAEVFYSMVEKGVSISELVTSLNEKLNCELTAKCSFSASIIEIDLQNNKLAVWNGGPTGIFVTDSESVIKQRLNGITTTLGAKRPITVSPVFIDIKNTDRVYLSMTDEASVSDVVATALENHIQESDSVVTDALVKALPEGTSLLKVSIANLERSRFRAVHKDIPLPITPLKFDFDFHATTLKKVDVIPVMLNAVLQMKAPYEHQLRMHTILVELFNNALEHGILQLNSALKHSAEGFGDYYNQRMAKLAEIEQGFIKVSISHQPWEQGGIFKVFVEDSGQGFEHQTTSQKTDNQKLSGRGLMLLKQLCSRVEFQGIGNSVSVDYVWS